MTIYFQSRGEFRFLIDGTPLIRQIHSAERPSDVARIPVIYGSASMELGELFTIAWEGNDGTTRWSGDLSNLSGLGACQSVGTTFVEGSIGCRTGAMMNGGQILVVGDAGDDLGLGMSGGTICVSGNAGDRVGGCLLGESQGMRGGLLCVGGNVGHDAGMRMLKGTVVIGGSAQSGLGFQMRAGTLLVNQGCAGEIGFEMIRGTILCLDPTTQLGGSIRFRLSGEFDLEICRVLARSLAREMKRIGADPVANKSWDSIRRVIDQLKHKTWRLYYGDHLQGGKGEILVAPAVTCTPHQV